MRAGAALLCAMALAGCSHDDPPPSTGSPDAGAPLTCPADEKPLGTSALTSGVFPAGRFKVGDAVTFVVPPGTSSITIVEQAVSAPDFVTLASPSGSIDNTAVPLVVRDPENNVVFDDNAPIQDPDLSRLKVFFASDSPATGTLTIPNTTAGLAMLGAAGLPAGSWSFIVSDFAYECTSPAASPLRNGITCAGGDDQSVYDVTVITKPAAGGAIPPAGKLDVAVYFATTIPSLNADTANAGGDPDLKRMETALGTLFAQAGIALGTVKYTLLPADVLATYATGVSIDQSGACAPLAQLLRHADAGNTLNIFFVSTFVESGQGGTIGIDGTIPGPASIGGTVASGAAVAAFDLRQASGTAACSGPFDLACGADKTAYIIAHEAGHFLGLYHTTESEGTLFDPLDDTLTCVCSVCATTTTDRAHCGTATLPHRMGIRECSQQPPANACGGGTNLMFWVLDPSLSKGELSAQQASVMRANPLVQTVP